MVVGQKVRLKNDHGVTGIVNQIQGSLCIVLTKSGSPIVVFENQIEPEEDKNES